MPAEYCVHKLSVHSINRFIIGTLIFSAFQYFALRPCLVRPLNLYRNEQNYRRGLYLVFFCPRTGPKTFLQCFALEQRESKAKQDEKTRYRIGPFNLQLDF